MHLLFLLILFVWSVNGMEDEKCPPMLLQIDAQACAKTDDPSTLTQQEVKILYWMFNKERKKPSPDEAMNTTRHNLLLEQQFAYIFPEVENYWCPTKYIAPSCCEMGVISSRHCKNTMVRSKSISGIYNGRLSMWT